MAKLVSLKRTAAEKKARDKEISKPIGGYDDYDYSTRLDLSGDTLEKLGIDVSKLKVDQKFTFQGEAYVKSLSSNRGNGYDRDSLCLQMTAIALEPKTKGGTLADAVSKGISEANENE